MNQLKKLSMTYHRRFDLMGQMVTNCVSHHSVLGRIIRVTQEVDEYREWIRKNWGNPSQNELPLNSTFTTSFVFNFKTSLDVLLI